METRFLAARDVLAILGVVPRSRLKPQPLKHRRPHAPLHEPESFPVSLKSGFWRPASVISRARTGAQFYQPIEHRPQMRARVFARSEPVSRLSSLFRTQEQSAPECSPIQRHAPRSAIFGAMAVK